MLINLVLKLRNAIGYKIYEAKRVRQIHKVFRKSQHELRFRQSIHMTEPCQPKLEPPVTGLRGLR